MAIIEAEVTHRLNAAGSWWARLPLTDKRTSEATTGRYFLQMREGEGLAFAGIIENVQKQPEETLELSGPTLLGELLYKNTLLNRQYTGTLNAAFDSLLALASGWSRNGSNTTTIDARFDGESVLKALLALIDQPRIHLRELITEVGNVLTKKVDIGAFGASAGVTMMNGNPDDVVLEDAALAVVESLEVLETVQDVWNWLIPLGAGDGKAQLTLRFSTRTTPYTIQTVAGPDGATIYFLSDAASITTYGQRERAFVAKDIGPLSNTKAALQAAANALYDVAVRQLQWWKDKQTAYRLTVRGLAPAVKPGDKVRLRYRGYAEHWGTGYSYLNVDTELWVLERTRRFFSDGTEVSELVVSDLDRQLQSATEIVIGKLEDTARAFRTKVQASVSNRTAGPILEEVNSSYPMNFDIFIDDNVTQLLRCKLRLKPRAIRSTATGAASGGSSSPTSSGGSSHSHSVSGQTASAGGAQTSSNQGSHRHRMAYIGGMAPGALTDRTWYAADVSGSLAHFVGRIDAAYEGGAKDLYTYETAPAHAHTVIDHTHSVTGATSGADTTHTHTVTIANHTHAQVYGIFEGTAAAGITISIKGTDRTAALGGPWSAAAILDITTYLLDADGVVVQGAAAISLGSTTLGRIEVWIDLVEVVQSIIAA